MSVCAIDQVIKKSNILQRGFTQMTFVEKNDMIIVNYDFNNK